MSYNLKYYFLMFQAAFWVIEHKNSGKPVYKVKQTTLNNLCEMYGAPINPYKEHMKNIYKKDSRFWARRPLTREMITYASSDAQNLVPTIYEAMSK